MSTTKSACGKVSRLLVNAKTSRSVLSHQNQLNTGKKDESKTLLSSDARPNTYLALKDVPGPSPSIPFIGTGWQYFPGARYSLANLHEASNDKYLRYGPIVKEEFQWRKPVIHLFNPDDFETVFRFQGPKPLRPISEFLKHYRLQNPDKYDSVGLANSVGDEWKRLRNILGPALMKLNALNGIIGKINEISEDFVTLLREKRDSDTFQIDNVQDLVYRLALEGVYMMSLDDRLGCLEFELRKDTPAFDMILSVKLLFEAFQELFYGLPLWKIIQTPSYKKLDRAESLMYDATSKRILAAMEKLRASPDDKEGSLSILETLLKTKDLTDKEIKVTVIDFLSGGIFTITNAFSFLIYHMSKNPDVQEKLYAELKERVPDCKINQEGLDKLPYLRACVKESFRLTPTIPCIARILPEDVTLSGYYIPAGTPIFCNFMVPCKQAERFPDPERFNPERWIKKTSRTNPFTLSPFGYGLRMCVGRRFAEMEIYTALAKLVTNFKLENPGQDVKCKQAFIVVPSNPVSVILKDR